MLRVHLVLAVCALLNRVQAVCLKGLVVSNVLDNDKLIVEALNVVELARKDSRPDNLGLFKSCRPLAFHLSDAEVEDQ